MKSFYDLMRPIEYEKEPEEQLHNLQIFDTFIDAQIDEFLDHKYLGWWNSVTVIQYWGYEKVKHKIPMLLEYLRGGSYMSEALIPMKQCIIPQIKNILQNTNDHYWHYNIINYIIQKWDNATIELLKDTLINFTINATDNKGAAIVALETIKDIIPANEFKKYNDYLRQKYTECNNQEMLGFLEEISNTSNKNPTPLKKLFKGIDYIDPKDQLDKLKVFDSITYKQIDELMHYIQFWESGVVIRYLGHKKLKYKIPELFRFIEDPNWEGATDVHKALIEMGETIIPEIKKFLKNTTDYEWHGNIIRFVVSKWNRGLRMQMKQELIKSILVADGEASTDGLQAIQDIISKEEYIMYYNYLANAYTKNEFMAWAFLDEIKKNYVAYMKNANLLL